MGKQKQKFDASDLFSFFSLLNIHEKRQPDSNILTWKEIYLLQYILKNKPASVTDIASYLHMPIIDVSRLVSVLQSRKILEKSGNRNDRRSVVVRITEQGKTVLKNTENELLAYLNNKNTHSSDDESSGDFFKNQYEQSSQLICTFRPVFDEDNEIADLEFLQANRAFIREFPGITTLICCSLLSRTVYQHFNIVISVCNTAWKTHKPVKILLDAKFQGKEYSCEWFRDDMNTIVVAAVPVNTAAQEYFHDIFPYYQFFFKNKPIKIVLECTTGRILAVNEAAVRFYGWTREQLLKKTIYEISLNRPETTRTNLEMAENSTELIFHTVHRTADNTLRNVEVHASSCLLGHTKVHFSNIMQENTPDISCSDSNDPAGCLKDNEADQSNVFSSKYRKLISDTSDLLHYIELKGKLCSYAAGDHFFEYGTMLPTFGFIVEGLFRVYYFSHTGKEYTLEYLRPGYSIDSLTFTDCFAAEEISIEAIIPGKVLVIEQNKFIRRAASDPDAFRFLYYLDKQRLTKLEQRGLSLLTDDAKERYERFINDESDIAGYLHGQDIASYLRMTPETLSRIRKSNQ
jgi:PAS domain S-box-containing protein